ncbi:hypothetical protein DTO207G8_4948 [Paecilomyces variotii]|nr:hypothetical protein DTO207G8_4948 [Paecilomyces variotii]
MYEKLVYFRDKADDIRQLLLNEPRGRPAMCTNLVLPPCNPKADAGFLIMESEEYPPMSGGNTICTATVLLETGMVPMKEPITEMLLDTAAGPVGITAEYYKVRVPGLGMISVDIAWGGMIYVVVDAASVGLRIDNRNGPKLIDIGERIKQAVQNAYTPVHPENPGIRGVSILEFTEPLRQEPSGEKVAVNTVVVAPGRGQLEVGEKFQHRSIIGSSFECHIRGTTKVGEYDAILPSVKGSAWITGYKQMFLDSTDPFPLGFRVGDQWHMSDAA